MFDNVLDDALRWVHIVGAITLLGSLLVTLVVVRPGLAKLSDESREAFLSAARPKLAMLVGIGILLLLVSGIYNYLVVMRAKHHGQPTYDMMMGIKILLAFIVFFLASALTGRSAVFQKIRDKGKMWLTITLLIGAAIVAIASFLRMMPQAGGA